jgi:AcrR family transcriptional regulator
MKKSERTSQFILEKVAPIFNKKGYTATSLSDLTTATGLTKGAIYGNFESKENLALEAFKINSKLVLNALGEKIADIQSPTAKLYAITNFYRDYYERSKGFGGCPVLNVGVDANHQNKALFDKVTWLIQRLQENLNKVVSDGVTVGEFKKGWPTARFARLIFSMIEGAVFLSVTREDNTYLSEMMDQIDFMIDKQMKI